MKIESYQKKEDIEKYTREGFYNKWTLCDYIYRWAKAFPDKEALIDINTRLTWLQYKNIMDKMALNFLDLGIKKGDFVVTQIPNSVEAIITEFALGRIGACIVPLAMQWRQHELDYVLGQTKATAVIILNEYGGYDYPSMIKDLKSNHDHLKHTIVIGDKAPDWTISYKKLWENNIEEKYPEDYLSKNCTLDANDVVTMCYTSGTEADPKGCPRTHNMWKSFARCFLLDFQLNGSDRVVTSLPWINIFAQVVTVLSMAMTGGTLILLDGFEPEGFAKILEKEKGTVYPGVPAMHIAMLSSLDFSLYDFSQLRLVVSGGAPCPTPVIKGLMEKFGCLVVNGWGSNEGTFNSTEIGLAPEIVSESIGVSEIFFETKIVDDKGSTVGVNETGEYCQRGPGLIGGYYERDDLNKKSWDEDGFFHTGDAVKRDENGFIHFVTRLKDIIIRGGLNISAEEVEFILYKHPKILNVAIVGMPDQKLGEKSCAFIELKPEAEKLSLKEITDFMEKEGVAKYKWPEKIEITNMLPRTPTGKVLKYKLREEISAKV